MTALFVGVDGGKSKTVCLLADASGSILGRGRGGASDKSMMPISTAIDVIASTVTTAKNHAGLGQREPDVGCFGLAGADWPEDFALLRERIEERRLARDVIVRNDAQIALRAAATTGIGMILSAGTHLSVALRTHDGDEWFSGWSSVDGPGGAEAGRRVIRAVLRASDGRGEATALTDLVREDTGQQPIDLLRAISRGEVDDAHMAALAPVLFRAQTEMRDAVAGQIIVELGDDMATWVTGLCVRYGLVDNEFDVFLAGGLFRGVGTLLRESLAVAVHRKAPLVRLHESQHEPVVGAVVGALERAGIPVTPDVFARLAATAPPSEFFDTG